MSRELERSINQVLRMPELADLANTIFQNIMQRTTAIQSESAELRGTETEGKQETTGTLGGLTPGGGVDTIGEEDGKGLVEDESGLDPIERVKRRIRGGIRIGFDEKPQDPDEGYLDLGQQAIIINKAHPAWKVAEGLTFQARDDRVRVYHTLRVVFTTLVEEAGVPTPKETLAKLFSAWHDSFLRG
jgi:hypothetical protein